MTDPEVRFLKQLLRAKFPNDGERQDGWIEVGRFVGIDHRTVETFDRNGLIETEGRNVSQTWARLKID